MTRWADFLLKIYTAVSTAIKIQFHLTDIYSLVASIMSFFLAPKVCTPTSLRSCSLNDAKVRRSISWRRKRSVYLAKPWRGVSQHSGLWLEANYAEVNLGSFWTWFLNLNQCLLNALLHIHIVSYFDFSVPVWQTHLAGHLPLQSGTGPAAPVALDAALRPCCHHD